MSSHSSAELDLDEIDLQTIEQLGFAPAEETSATFLDALRTLAQMPEMGSLRPDLDPPGRTFRYWTVLRRFLIVYQPIQGGIRVARIVNASREVGAILDHGPGAYRREHGTQRRSVSRAFGAVVTCCACESSW